MPSLMRPFWQRIKTWALVLWQRIKTWALVLWQRIKTWALVLKRFSLSFLNAFKAFAARHLEFKPENRFKYVLLAAVCSLLLLGFFEFLPPEWFPLLHDNKVSILGNSVLGGLVVSPVLFVLWLFRDQNTLWQIENSRKDINLKDFQKLSEWATAQHFGKSDAITTEKHQGNATLQAAAVHQLGAYLQGEYGQQFIRPAFELLKSLWAAQMDAVLAPLQSSSEEQKKEAVKEAQQTPLMRALTVALFANDGAALHQKAIQNILAGTQWIGLDSQLSDLAEAKLDLSQLNLQAVNFRYANFNGADLQGADLQKANLQEANLQSAILVLTDLRGAKLRGANLMYANFIGADLTYANFIGANLTYADLSGADLSGADLSGAGLWACKYSPKTNWQNCQTNANTKCGFWDDKGIFEREKTNALRSKLGLPPLRPNEER